jgi:hypothetical protein
MKQNTSSEKITTKAALIDFYMALKQYSLEVKNKKKEKPNIEYLSSMTELELIDYIKESIDTVILTLAEKKINDYNNQITCENIQQDYEAMLVKYEQDIRGHIKVEHQLKLYSDSLQSNLEELEKEKKLGFNNNSNNNNYINEIQILKKEIKYQKKLIKSYEDQNIKSAENEKKLKSIIAKNEKKYKSEIDTLNKKLKYYIEKINILCNEKNEKIEKRKSETICCNSSRRSNNPNIIKNFIENDGINTNIHKMNNSLHGIGRIYRNLGNSLSISDNHSTSMANTRPYAKVDKDILNKYIKNSKEPYQYQNRMKNLKNVSNLRSTNIHSCINIPNNNNNNSYLLDSKAQDEIINKYMMNDSFMNNKKIYNRHKSVENNSNNYIKGKNIKKLLMQNNNNSNKNSYKDVNKGFYNKSLMNKKYVNNSSNNSINSEKNYMNKTTKEININNIIESKNNIGCNFVNNINIYSNNLKQDNGNNNIYIGNNIKKYAGNTSFRSINKNNNLNGTNYIHIHGNKNNNNVISYRNKQKEGKMISSISVQKKY